MKQATPNEVRHHQKVTRDLMLSKIKEMNCAIDAYIDEECDEREIKKVSETGDTAIRVAIGWLEELEQALDIIRTRDILLLDEIRRNVDPFQEENDRCVIEFL